MPRNGMTEQALQKRMEQINGILDTAYKDMGDWKSISMMPVTEDNQMQVAEARSNYTMAENTYLRFMNVLIAATKNYDEAVKTDTSISRRKAETGKPTTTLQKLRQKEQKNG